MTPQELWIMQVTLLNKKRLYFLPDNTQLLKYYESGYTPYEVIEKCGAILYLFKP